MDIAIASGKGGTGKTTLAVNLASFGQKIINNLIDQIVLIDLDVEEPNAGLFLNSTLKHEEKIFRPVPVWIEENCSLCGKCREICQFNAIAQLPQTLLIYPELCHSCFACSGLCPEQALRMTNWEIGTLKHHCIPNKFGECTNLSFIESILKLGEPSAVSLIQQTKDYVKKNFQADSFNIFDCPPGTSCPVIESVKDADYTILVTEPTPFGFHDLKLAVETMKKLGRAFGVVVNRYNIGNNEVFQYCDSENIDILAKIPNDRKIAEQYAQGELVYTRFPGFKKQLARILEHILKKKELTTFAQSSKRESQISILLESYRHNHSYS